MKRKLVAVGSIGAFAMVAAFGAAAEKPAGWFMAGLAPQDFTAELDNDTKHSGETSVRMAANTATPAGFGTLMQQFDAAPFHGKRIRFRGHVKTADRPGQAGLWMRVDGPDGKSQAFDNMSNRPIAGTLDWKAYDIVLDIPTDAKIIALGVLVQGPGTLWLDECSFEEVSKDVPVTDMMLEDSAEPAGPKNLGLEPANS